jgi:hypothetical protein
LPAGFVRGSDVSILAPVKDLKDDIIAAGVDQPILVNASAMIRVAQVDGVLRDGAVADDFQHPIRRAFNFHTAFLLRLDVTHLAAVKAFPEHGDYVGIIGNTCGGIRHQNTVDEQVSEVSLFIELEHGAGDGRLDRRMGEDIFLAHVEINLTVEKSDALLLGEFVGVYPGAKAGQGVGVRRNVQEEIAVALIVERAGGMDLSVAAMVHAV